MIVTGRNDWVPYLTMNFNKIFSNLIYEKEHHELFNRRWSKPFCFQVKRQVPEY